MNIYNLDLAPQTPATLWHMHPADLCRVSDDFASLQRHAAMDVRNPAYVATDSVQFDTLHERLGRHWPVLVIYPPAGLSEHVCELALAQPTFESRCASDYRQQAAYFTWTVRNVRVCIPADALNPWFCDEDDAPEPSHFVVVFVGRDDVAAQAVAVDSDYYADFADCWRWMTHEAAHGMSNDEEWLDLHEHRGPCFLYEDNPDCARSEDDWVWVFLQHFNWS